MELPLGVGATVGIVVPLPVVLLLAVVVTTGVGEAVAGEGLVEGAEAVEFGAGEG